MKVNIKKLHPDAVIPSYAKEGDAGMDLTAISKTDDEFGNTIYGTGLSFEVPENYFMILVPRSSNHKTDLLLTNHCGIVDSGYRGEVMFKFRNLGIYVNPQKEEDSTFKYLPEYEIGDRIGQLIIMPYPKVAFEEAEELSSSERGEGGYGSTGK